MKTEYLTSFGMMVTKPRRVNGKSEESNIEIRFIHKTLEMLMNQKYKVSSRQR